MGLAAFAYIPAQLMEALLPWLNPQFLLQPELVRLPPPSLMIWSDASLEGWELGGRSLPKTKLGGALGTLHVLELRSSRRFE